MSVIIIVHSSGIGPKRAIDLIKQYKTIEEIVKHIDTKVTHYTGLYREDPSLSSSASSLKE